MDVNKENRFWDTITILYLFLSFMIVLYHNNGYSFYSVESDTTIIAIDAIKNGYLANIPVPMFFFLSAFLLFRNLTPDNLRTKMKSRLISLVIPYLSWNALVGLALWLLQIIPLTRAAMQVREMALFDPISIVKGLTIDPYDGVLWTMLQIMVFTVLAPIFLFLLRNWRAGIIVLIAGFLFVYSKISIPLVFHGNEHLFTYLLGAYLGIHCFNRIIELEYKDYYAILSMIFISLLAFLFHKGVPMIYIYMPGIVCLYLVVNYISKYFAGCSKKWYGYSLWIYTMHILIEPCFSKMVLLLGPQGDAGAWINIVICSTATVVFCVAIAFFCKKEFKGVFFILSGGRG